MTGPAPDRVAAAAACFAEGYRLLDTLPVEEAAQRAWTPTGPTIAELEARIRARRAELHQTPAPAVATPVPRRERVAIQQKLLACSRPAESGCREWIRAKDSSGYGTVHIDGRQVGAHRAAYEAWVGPIPDEMTVDHLCFNPACIDPEHLRILSGPENARLRRNANKTHCAHGHELTPDNVRIKKRRQGWIYRACRECENAYRRAARARKSA